MEIYQEISKCIKKSGYKQKTIAEKCGYDQKTFSLMMNGRKKISVDDLRNICIALDVDANTFIKIK